MQNKATLRYKIEVPICIQRIKRDTVTRILVIILTLSVRTSRPLSQYKPELSWQSAGFQNGRTGVRFSRSKRH